jgi:hypothetical protein
VDKLFPSFLAIDSKSRHIVILNQRKSSCKKYRTDLNFNRLLTVLFFQMASFIKGLIDKVEGGGSGKQYQNEQHSSPQGFNPQQQHGGPWTQQGKTDFGACQQEQHYDEVYFLGQPPHNPYQEGYGQQGYNHQAGPPPPFAHSQPPSYGNQGQYGMTHRQEGEEHRRGGSPRQFEGREQEYEHNRGRQQEHNRERNRSPDEYKYQQRPEGHGRDREQNREHERRRSRSRD